MAEITLDLDDVTIELDVGGGAGTDGSDGADGTPGGHTYTYDGVNTTDADPGAGIIRFDNLTLSSATEAYISDLTAATGNPDIEVELLSWDDSTTTALRGTLVIVEPSTPANMQIFNITGASTDNTDYVTLAVTHVDGSGSFADAASLGIQFARTGNSGAGTGDVVGPGSATDNAVARFDGAGTLLQNSGIIVDDSDNVTGINDATVSGQLGVGASSTNNVGITLGGTVTTTSSPYGVWSGSLTLEPGSASRSAFVYHADAEIDTGAGNTIVAAYDFYGAALSEIGTGSVTTAVTGYFAAQTIGTTTNLSIWSVGDAQFDASVTIGSGASVNEFSTDGTMAGNSSTAVPVESAVVTYTALNLGVGSPTVNTFQEYLNSTGSSGFFDGGAVTDGGSGTVDVAAGSGFIRDSASSIAELKSFKWSASAGIAVTDDTTQYIFVDDTGAITLSTNEFLEAEDNILIGCVTDEGGSIVSVFNLGVRLDESIAQAGRYIRRVHSVVYDKRRGGLMFSETGTRNIVMTAGYLWWGRTDYSITALDTSAASTFTTYSVTGQEAAAATAWDNTQYDNAGTLTTMANNRWANHYFFLEPNGNLTMIYGRAQYTTQELAEAEAVPTTSLPNKITAAGVLAARFTFQESASTATISSAFGVNFSGSGSSSTEFADNVFRIQDDGDATKEIAFQASGITTATVRTITMPDADVNLGTDFEAVDADILRADTDDTLTAGFATTPVNDGDKDTGATPYVPAAAGGNLKYITNSGIFDLDPMVLDGTCIVEMENITSAGIMTTGSFDKVTGDDLTATVGHKFMFYITVNNTSHLHITAMQ